MRGHNYKAVISYDGTDFFGFQRQAGLPTVQETLEDAIIEAFDEETHVFASSRTDKGVHALGQVITFTMSKKLNLSGMKSLLETQLPPTIVIKEIDYAPQNFIARFASRRKVYAYIIHEGLTNSPFVKRGCWVIPNSKLDRNILQTTFIRFIGHHDFSCFGKASSESDNKDPHCTIEEADVDFKNNYIVFTLKGDRFLHNMVRRMVSFAVFCAKGKENPDRLDRIFKGEMSLSAAFPAPAQGLYLVKVDYDV